MKDGDTFKVDWIIDGEDGIEKDDQDRSVTHKNKGGANNYTDIYPGWSLTANRLRSATTMDNSFT